MKLPKRFVKIFTDLYDNEGKVWLEHLPQTIKQLEGQWNIQVQEHFSNLTYNFVSPAIRHDGTPVVLKLGFPEELELESMERSHASCNNTLLNYGFRI